MSRSVLSSRDRVAIALGGVVGAVCRALIGTAANRTGNDGGWFAYAPNSSVTFFPYDGLASGRWGTVAANLIGCLVLGAIATMVVRQSVPSRRMLLAAGTGFCGALTTFATFAVETVVLLRVRPLGSDLPLFASSEPGPALIYVAVSLVGGALAFWLGRAAAREFVPA